MEFHVHDLQTAPEGSAPILGEVRSRYGFIPHLLGVMANAPSLLRAYLGLQALFEETSLSPVERQVVLLEVSATNGCAYCVAAHTVMAERQGVPPAVTAAIRDRAAIPDARLQALRELAGEMTARRGWPSEAAIGRFLEVGFTPPQLLEVVLGVGMKTLSNYTNHVALTPIDAQFAASAWQAPERS